jgi:hypothetical protein
MNNRMSESIEGQQQQQSNSNNHNEEEEQQQDGNDIIRDISLLQLSRTNNNNCSNINNLIEQANCGGLYLPPSTLLSPSLIEHGHFKVAMFG